MYICVYGASSDEINDRYINEGEKLGLEMTRRGMNLVFGAGANGMMGAVARGVSKGGGHIVGVVPRFFNVDGIIYDKCDELIRTDTMRERKQIMEDRADAFIMTAGGIGTFEEFFEILTLKQLGRHTKPIVMLNTDGYFNKMEDMMRDAIAQKFIFESVSELYAVCDSVENALDYIDGYKCEKIDASDYKKV
jgi:uncharacterized protein (TIGR00730 family)